MADDRRASDRKFQCPAPGRDTAALLRKSLPSARRAQLRAAARVARRLRMPTYLIGGSVRDLLRGSSSPDLDLTVVGDGRRFAHALAAELDAPASESPRFLTAKIHTLDSAIDVATARCETYPRPGALPRVTPGSIDDDLARRDFTVNAMAVRLDAPGAPTLLDPCGGRADLTRRRLRVLHDRSFVDDPTRLLRAARYAARLGFGLERRTRRLAEAAVRDGCLDTVSGDRIRRELMMLLGEPRAAVGVKLLARVGVLRCVHPALAIGADTTRALRIARQLCARLSGKGADANASCAVVRLLIIADGLRPDQVRALADRLRLTAAQRKALVDYARVKTQARRALAAATASNSAVVRALEGLPQETVLAIGATSSPAVRRRCELFLGELKQVRARITGKDLAQLGHAPAPAWRHALAAARDARLDGCARTKAQELRVATEILGSGSQARAPVPQAKADVV